MKVHKHGKRYRIWKDGTWIVRDSEEALQPFLVRKSSAESTNGRRLNPRHGLAALCNRWLEAQTPDLRARTVKTYGATIRLYVPDVDPETFKPKDMVELLRSIPPGTKDVRSVINQTYKWAIVNDDLKRRDNPCAALPARRRPPTEEKAVPSVHDVQKLLADATGDWWRYLRLATITGARPGEICALHSDDYSRPTEGASTGGKLRIWRSADPISRQIGPLKNQWSTRILHLTLDLDTPSGFWFPSNGGILPCWTTSHLTHRLDKACERTNITRYTPHAFRHFVATQLLDKGWPSSQVARYLGHKDDTMVRQLYGNHVVDETQRAIGEAASGLA